MGNFDRVNATEPSLDRAQKRIQDGIGRGNPPMNDGAEVSFTIDNNALRMIPHKLERKARGFQVISEQGDGVGSLQAVDFGTKAIRFRLRVPAGAPTTTITYKVWIF